MENIFGSNYNVTFKCMKIDRNLFLSLLLFKREVSATIGILTYLDGLHVALKASTAGSRKNFSNPTIFILPLSSVSSHSWFCLEATACHSTFLRMHNDSTSRVSCVLSDALAFPDVRRREKMRPALDFNPMEF